MINHFIHEYFVIRHKQTGELMPQMRRGRGYSHWNPNSEIASSVCMRLALGVPRLLETEKKAKRCIIMWDQLPNSKNTFDYDGEADLDIKDDNRKRDDLEVVRVILTDMKMQIRE